MKYAFVFLLLGAVLVYQASTSPTALWLRFLIGWAGASFLLVGLAYGVGRTDVFGKRPDGSLRGLNLVALLPYFLLTWLIWRISITLTREPAFTWITPRMAVGRRLLAAEARPSVDAVVDLTAEFPETAALCQGRYRCLPTLDGCALDAQRLAEEAYRLGSSQETVFIHCAQGHGRSGMFAAICLMAMDSDLSVDAALVQLRAQRPGIGWSRAQRQAVEQAAAWMASWRREQGCGPGGGDRPGVGGRIDLAPGVLVK